jgi:hypothetical protein
MGGEAKKIRWSLFGDQTRGRDGLRWQGRAGNIPGRGEDIAGDTEAAHDIKATHESCASALPKGNMGETGGAG